MITKLRGLTKLAPKFEKKKIIHLHFDKQFSYTDSLGPLLSVPKTGDSSEPLAWKQTLLV